MGEVEEYFARSCLEADERLGEAAACRWFLNWFDDTPREEMRDELLGEVERAIEARFAEIVPAVPIAIEDPFAGIALVA